MTLEDKLVMVWQETEEILEQQRQIVEAEQEKALILLQKQRQLEKAEKEKALKKQQMEQERKRHIRRVSGLSFLAGAALTANVLFWGPMAYDKVGSFFIDTSSVVTASSIESFAAMHKAGDLDAALEGYAKISTNNPSFNDARIAMGDIYMEKSMYDKALEEYFLAGEKFAGDNLKLKIAKAFYELGEYEKSRWSIENILEKEMEDLRDRINAIDGKDGDIQIKAEYIHNFIGDISVKDGDISNAMKEYRITLSSNGENVYALCKLGGILLENGLLKEAIPLLKKAAVIEPANPDTLLGLAMAYQKKGDTDQYQEVMQKALGIMPDDPDICSAHGYALASEGRLVEAEPFLNKVLKVDPVNVKALKGKGLIAMKRGDLEMARRYFNWCQVIDPSDGHTLVSIGDTIAKEDDSLAFKVSKYWLAIEVDPLCYEAYDRLHTIASVEKDKYMKNEFYNRSIQALTQSLEKNPDNLNALLRLAKYHNECGRDDVADTYMRKAYELDTDIRERMVEMGLAYLKAGHASEAIPILEAAQDIDMQKSTYLLLCRAYAIDDFGRWNRRRVPASWEEDCNKARVSTGSNWDDPDDVQSYSGIGSSSRPIIFICPACPDE